MNQTIEERVRCMLSHAKLPKSFWGEAVSTVVGIINLSPLVPLDGAIPEEIWSNQKESYNHLKVSDCRAFVHIPKDKRAKLDSKTRERIVVLNLYRKCTMPVVASNGKYGSYPQRTCFQVPELFPNSI